MTRIPDFDTHPGSAAGLGLAIVAAIVSAHGGRLDATSEPRRAAGARSPV